MLLENKLLKADCLEFMRDNKFKVDYVLACPPDYEDIKHLVKDYNEYLHFLNMLGFKLMEKCDVITISVTDRKKDGEIITKHSIITDNFRANGFKLKYQKLWIKSFKTNLYCPNYSFLLTYVNEESKKKFKKANNAPDCFQYPQHLPRIMSIDIAMEMINMFTDVGDLVYDPVMGTGTTALACRNLNRKYIGTEIDEEIYNESVERLK